MWAPQASFHIVCVRIEDSFCVKIVFYDIHHKRFSKSRPVLVWLKGH